MEVEGWRVLFHLVLGAGFLERELDALRNWDVVVTSYCGGAEELDKIGKVVAALWGLTALAIGLSISERSRIGRVPCHVRESGATGWGLQGFSRA